MVSRKLKSEKPLMYRQIELLLLMVCEMTDRSFKRSRALPVMNECLITDIRETLSYGAMILNTLDMLLKANCCIAIKTRIWVISTTLERIYFSASNTRHHFLSEDLYGRIIDCINLIEGYLEKLI